MKKNTYWIKDKEKENCTPVLVLGHDNYVNLRIEIPEEIASLDCLMNLLASISRLLSIKISAKLFKIRGKRN